MKNLLFFFLFVVHISVAQNGKEKIMVTDLTKIKQISNITVSPDGKSAVYLLKTTEQNEENKLEYDYRTHLYLTDFKTVRQMTRGVESVSAAVWSPDSKQIAFSRNVKALQTSK